MLHCFHPRTANALLNYGELCLGVLSRCTQSSDIRTPGASLRMLGDVRGLQRQTCVSALDRAYIQLCPNSETLSESV